MLRVTSFTFESRHCNGLHEVPVEASKAMRKLHVFWFLLAELAAGAVSAQSSPQDAPATAQASTPKIKVETRVVLVDVVVTVAKGDSVLNLKKDDFRIAEDGSTQTITSFEEHKLDHSKPAVLPTMPPNVYTNFPTAKPPDSVNVLLLDMLNTQPSNQSYVREQAVKYLSGAPPGTRMAIFALHKNLRLMRGFTTDFLGIAAALDDKNLGARPEVSPTNPQPKHGAPRAGANTELKEPLMRYGVNFAVSVDDLGLTTARDGVRHGHLEEMVAACDKEGRILNLAKQESKLSVGPGDYSKLRTIGLQFHQEIDVPLGEVILRAGIYDFDSGNAGTIGIPLGTPAPPKKAKK
jgi:hypothetical protein